MNTLYKPNGIKMTVNDESLEYALSLGWTKSDPTVKKPIKSAAKRSIPRSKKAK